MKEYNRPPVLKGKTYRFQTGCGKLYVTINWDGDEIKEIFGNLGKAGTCAAASQQALGRVISEALQQGVHPLDLAKKLRGIGCNMPSLTEPKVLSCWDAFGMALEEACKGECGNGRESFRKT